MLKYLLLILLLSTVSHANDFRNKKFLISPISYLKHTGNNDKEYTENFDNHLFILGVNIDKKNTLKLIGGTLKNSFNFKCGMIGLAKDWVKISENLDFVGMYAYVGDIPYTSCKNCSTEGIYATFRRHTGIGFAPYIYHGIRYNMTNNIGINAGFIFPKLLAGSLEIRF